MTAPSSGSPLRIVFFTTLPADAAIAVIGLFRQLGYDVPLVVTSPGPKSRPQLTYRDIVAALPAGQDALVTSHMSRVAQLLAPLQPDLIFTASFPWRLPADVLSLPRLGAINAHPALLPRHRGPNPLYWTLYHGDTRAGLTFHRMAADFDTGPILAQVPIDVAPEDDVDSLMSRMVVAGAAALPGVLAAAARGEPGIPQNEANATYAPLCADEDRWLDWTRTATELSNHVRAWGRAGAWAALDGQQISVRRAAVEPQSTPLGISGSVLSSSPEGIKVQTGSGVLVVTQYEPIAG